MNILQHDLFLWNYIYNKVKNVMLQSDIYISFTNAPELIVGDLIISDDKKHLRFKNPPTRDNEQE